MFLILGTVLWGLLYKSIINYVRDFKTREILNTIGRQNAAFKVLPNISTILIEPRPAYCEVRLRYVFNN